MVQELNPIGISLEFIGFPIGVNGFYTLALSARAGAVLM